MPCDVRSSPNEVFLSFIQFLEFGKKLSKLCLLAAFNKPHLWPHIYGGLRRRSPKYCLKLRNLHLWSSSRILTKLFPTLQERHGEHTESVTLSDCDLKCIYGFVSSVPDHSSFVVGNIAFFCSGLQLQLLAPSCSILWVSTPKLEAMRHPLPKN